jgi:hypothetical protein
LLEALVCVEIDEIVDLDLVLLLVEICAGEFQYLQAGHKYGNEAGVINPEDSPGLRAMLIDQDLKMEDELRRNFAMTFHESGH